MNIKKRIKEQGMTIVEVAAKLNVTQPTLSQIISNGNPSYSKLCDIAGVLGITVSELVSDDSESSGATIVCPHCGKAVKIKIEKEG